MNIIRTKEKLVKDLCSTKFSLTILGEKYETITFIQSFPSYEKFGFVLYWNVRSVDCFHMKCLTVRKSMLGSTTY